MCTAWHAQHVLAIGAQSVVQPIAGAGMQLGRETGWCLIFMEIVWGVYSQKHLFCMGLRRNSLNVVAQTHHTHCLLTHIITTISLEIYVLVRIYALYFTVVDPWRRSGSVRSQSVVQPIARADMQFGRETRWCLEFMKRILFLTANPPFVYAFES